jgi:BASS family bile acid:Na+ symporter
LLLRLLRSRDLVLLAALALGLVVSGPARFTHHAVLPLLALIMTLSLLGVTSADLRSVRRLAAASWRGVALSYGVQSGVLIALSLVLPMPAQLREGFWIIAAAPPAVAVIPFTEVLGGDRPFSLLAMSGCYLAALVLMPLMFLVFWELEAFNFWELVRVLLLLVAGPLAASRAILALGWGPTLEPVRGLVSNWSFFVVCYSLVGLNAPGILQRPAEVWPAAAGAACATVALGAVLEAAWRRAGVERARRASLVLLATLKNYGLAGGLALELLGTRSALPAVASVVMMFIHLLLYSQLRRRTGA